MQIFSFSYLEKKILLKKAIFVTLFLAAAIGFGYKVWDVYKVKISLLLLDNEITKVDEQQVLATFDPEDKIPDSFQHYRLKVNAKSNWQLEKDELSKIPADTPVLLTIEIWGYGVLEAIADGSYDREISEMLKPLVSRKDLILRFNPEMEIPDNNNTWSNWGRRYVTAFQHFSNLSKAVLPEAKVMWSPAGAMGNMEYYPGKETFEVAGISLNKDDETDLFLKNKSPSEELKRKLHRMRFVNTPLLILGPEGLSSENPVLFEYAFQQFKRSKVLTSLEDLSEEKNLREDAPLLGVYDPEEKLTDAPAVGLEHLFIGFEGIENGTFDKEFKEVLSRGHDVIITLEPQNYPENIKETNVLEQILEGKYDPLLHRFFTILTETQNNIYFRFAHEMEIPVERYAWQMQEPLLYIKAFRYVMQYPGSEAEHIKKIWAPAGDRGAVDWWPGSDVVDFISMSIYGLPDKNITDFKKQESFEKIYDRKKKRLDLFGKPFFIAEFGVKGDEEYQKLWLLNAAEVINLNKEIHGVSYFNNPDLPDAWGEITPPDWSIKPSVFSLFSKALKDQK